MNVNRFEFRNVYTLRLILFITLSNFLLSFSQQQTIQLQSLAPRRRLEHFTGRLSGHCGGGMRRSLQTSGMGRILPQFQLADGQAMGSGKHLFLPHALYGHGKLATQFGPHGDYFQECDQYCHYGW